MSTPADAATQPEPSPASPEQEVVVLRARVAALEHELVEVTARANSAVAAAQDRAYWLDRWHLDLNALMARPGAAQFRAALRAFRSVTRFFKRLSRRLRG